MKKVAHEQIFTKIVLGTQECMLLWMFRKRQRETENNRERQRMTEREKSLFQTAMRRAG